MSTKRRILKNQQLYPVALILILAASLMVATSIQCSAQTYTKSFSTYGYLVVTPNPVGVNQAANIVFWLDSSPPNFLDNPTMAGKA